MKAGIISFDNASNTILQLLVFFAPVLSVLIPGSVHYLKKGALVRGIFLVILSPVIGALNFLVLIIFFLAGDHFFGRYNNTGYYFGYFCSVGIWIVVFLMIKTFLHFFKADTLSPDL
ncbi:hypothetical protein ACO0LG_16065 [Undibacterium sp. Ji42W]|uniref:hypothetical protein n=1 Tax=Undibacterium sp. Ji42W TaxID=3413039 RepID=UPI003BF4521A